MNLVIDINVGKHLHNGLIVLNSAILLYRILDLR